ncbi:NUDIX domain-containing protein [Legionella sp. D16C41]|uniref:NUDIX domain-containing protein n=1 Tax=Legionella sp. D16C41 TaxID=3402688 RepID=UPI003AF8C2EC
MDKKAKILQEKSLHKGYLSLAKYNFEVLSLANQKKAIVISEREVITTSDSVSILLYLPSLDSFIFCQQFRPGVFLNATNDNSFILECVAGNIDSGESPEEAACREVKEETGLVIKNLQLIANVYKSPGLLTEKNYLFYAEVAKPPQGKLHGIDDEQIITQVIEREKVYELMDKRQLLDAATLLTLNWFRAQA